MVRRTKEQRGFLKACREIWPEAAELENSKLIQILKKEGRGSSFANKIEEYLEANGELVDNKNHSQRSITGFHNSGGLLGANERTYIVKDAEGNIVGKMIYTEAKSPFIGYAGSVILAGFDKRSSTYKKLVRDLNEFKDVVPNSYDWFKLIHKDSGVPDAAQIFYEAEWDVDMAEGERNSK